MIACKLAFLHIIIERLVDTWSNTFDMCLVLVQIVAGMLTLQTKLFAMWVSSVLLKHIPVLT